jgi:hypothetical protein
MTGNAFTRESYIPKGSTKVQDKESGAVAYLYERNGVPYAAAFYGKAVKPNWHYRFRSPESRESQLRKFFAGCRERNARVAERRKARREFQHHYQVGEILNTCWGYEQTNREFFEVVEIRGKFLILREVAQARHEHAWAQGTCVPLPGQYIGEPIRRLAGQYGVKIDDVRTAHKSTTQTVGGVKVVKPIGWTAYH